MRLGLASFPGLLRQSKTGGGEGLGTRLAWSGVSE